MTLQVENERKKIDTFEVEDDIRRRRCRVRRYKTKEETVGVEDGRGRKCCRGRKRKKEKILQR